MKIISWNVNGIRAIAKKNFFEDYEKMNADILCLQETKAQDHQVLETLKDLNELFIYTNSAERPGYSGVAVISKEKALKVTKGIGIDEHDKEGRVLQLEFEKFVLVNVYVPNSGNALKRLAYRQDWDLEFHKYLKEIEKEKPVIVCGDFNVAHKDIDLARPKPNYNKSAGYMQEEIDGMDRFTKADLIDTFRFFNPEETGKYSWWSYRAGARERNVGWRIDYFLVSKVFLPTINKAYILNEVLGSDHCPVGIELDQ